MRRCTYYRVTGGKISQQKEGVKKNHKGQRNVVLFYLIPHTLATRTLTRILLSSSAQGGRRFDTLVGTSLLGNKDN